VNTSTTKKSSFTRLQFSKQQTIIFGIFLAILGIALTISFISFLFTWQADQSLLSDFTNREEQAQNLLNKFGAAVSHLFIYKGFGVAALIFSLLLTLNGIFLFFSLPVKPLKKLL